MAENEVKELQSVSGEQVEDMTPDYVAAIKELKQNSVDRSQYDALKAENKKLLNSIVNGQYVETEAPKPQVNIDDLRKKLFNNENQTNLEYVKNCLELRNALIERGEHDPFVPSGSQYNPTQADYEKADRVAKVLQEMIDDSDGDPNVFLNEYQRRVKK
jgi:hypothetical protein